MSQADSDINLAIAHAQRDRKRTPMVFLPPPRTPTGPYNAYLQAYHNVKDEGVSAASEKLLKQEIEMNHQGGNFK